jgi:hypothetical protein
MKSDHVSRSNRAALDTLTAEATVDCYNSECVTSFYAMLDEISPTLR